jgi:hypothetical protein
MEARKQSCCLTLPLSNQKQKFAQRCLRLNGHNHSAEKYLHIHARLALDALDCGIVVDCTQPRDGNIF